LNFDGTFATDGTTLSLGSVLGAPLPSGTISAFGLLVDSNTDTQRVNLFQIDATAIPEPSTYALLAAGAALGLAVLRRRRA
jgi:S1-C subfamily serine protease